MIKNKTIEENEVVRKKLGNVGIRNIELEKGKKIRPKTDVQGVRRGLMVMKI